MSTNEPNNHTFQHPVLNASQRAAALAASKPIPVHLHDILTDRPTAYLATMRPDGRISVNPMAALFDGHVLQLSTTIERKKYRNLCADERITVCVPHRNNPNRYVELRGRALIEADDDRSFINRIAQVYMGVEIYPFDPPGERRVTITVLVDAISAPPVPLASNPPTAPDAPR